MIRASARPQGLPDLEDGRSRRLLILLPSRARGGAEDYALTIGRGAVLAGWTVHAALPVCDGTTALCADLERAGIAVRHVDLVESDDPREYGARALVRNLTNAWRTARVLRTLRPDVVHAGLPWPTFCYGSQMALSAFRWPTLITFHLVPEGLLVSDRRKVAYARFRARGQQWLAVSDYSRRLISEAFGVPRDQIAMIHNGIRVPAGDPPAERAAIRASVRQEFNLPESTRILLTVGRLAEQKGHAVLIPAIARIVQAYPDVVFMWAGDGEQRGALAASLEEHGVAANVLMTGPRTDVSRLLRAADLFVFPTLFEGLPFALLEAMAARLTIVSSDAASIPEVIEAGRDGILVPTGDTRALEASLLEILGDPDRASTLAAHARERVLQFTEERMIARTLSALANSASGADRTGVSL